MLWTLGALPGGGVSGHGSRCQHARPAGPAGFSGLEVQGVECSAWGSGSSFGRQGPPPVRKTGADCWKTVLLGYALEAV